MLRDLPLQRCSAAMKVRRAWTAGRWRWFLSVTGMVAELGAAVEFDAGLLRGGSTLDVSRYQISAGVPEGDYTLDVLLNQQWVGRRAISLRVFDPSGQAVPCYDQALLDSLGLDMTQLAPRPLKALAQAGSCVALSSLMLLASEDLDFGALRLSLDIAQSALRRQPQDHLPVETWDPGVTAGFVDYRFNVHEQHDLRHGQRSRQGYLGLHLGLNTGSWYWRHEGSARASAGGAAHYRAGATSVRHDIPTWRAQVTLGDSYAAGEVFDSSPLRGVSLSSDERMLPRSQRGFAPVVRGAANSTALLSIRQRGALLHETTVPPGPFEVDDLPASGLNDDLEVALRESDGSVRRFTVPYQAAPLALREGASRLDFSAGVWRDDVGRTGPGHVQGSWQQGLNNVFSVHGGAWIAEGYQAGALGAAINSPVGAFGLTGYHAHSAAARRRPVQGQALRLNWRQRIAPIAMELSASLTQRHNAHYSTFNEFARAAGSGRPGMSQRWRAALGIHQRLPGGGRLSLSASGGERWADTASNSEYSVGYHHHLGSLSYGLTLAREYRGIGGQSNALRLTMSLPLGEQRRGSLSSSLNRDSEGGGASNLRWSATAGEAGQWGYGLSATQQAGAGGGAGLDANLLHRSSAGEWTAALAQHSGSRQLALGARGAVVGHAGGVMLSQSLGESFAIVHAPHAHAAAIQQHPSVRLDARGFAVVPSLSPYSVNTVELDPQGMSRDVELQVSGQSVIPRSGAATLLSYPTRSGRLRVLEARDGHGNVLPFGAQVFDAEGVEVGLVGQGSRLHIRLSDEQGRVRVSWGTGAEASCWLEVSDGSDARCVAAQADS